MNTISKLKVRGENLIEPKEIQKEIVTYYEELYSEPEEWRPYLEMRNCTMIHEEENILLLAPFEEQEILESIKACAGDKAPGPNGYSVAFFTQC